MLPTPGPTLMRGLHNEELLYFVNRAQQPAPPRTRPAALLLRPPLSSSAFCKVLTGLAACFART